MKKVLLNFLSIIGCSILSLHAQKVQTQVSYQISFPQVEKHEIHVSMECVITKKDSIVLKMPEWTPGYYQIMHYGNNVLDFKTKDGAPFNQSNDHTWIIYPKKSGKLFISYNIKTDRKFVATSWVDSTHAYIIPAGTFLYIDQQLHLPALVKINFPKGWSDVATGLDMDKRMNQYYATDFDILYDCPILIGKLESLPSFNIKGIPHHFTGYQFSDFDKVNFMKDVEKIISAATQIMGGAIPYKSYSFIGIGEGMGGIEHLNNTTISFDGKGINTTSGKIRTYNFLAHEYFHHYNVKRIRPIELGPFDYEHGSRSNLLWISEGLTVYYEYLILIKAGLTNEEMLLQNLSHNIQAYESGPGKLNQSLTEASYATWSDGPFGRQGNEAAQSISYYDKGPILGLLLDIEIRNASHHSKSLNDVMIELYNQFYLGKKRGFSEAEFQETCERIAGKSLQKIFKYVYTTAPIDYNALLAPAGLQLKIQSQKPTYILEKLPTLTATQQQLYDQWMQVK